MIAREEEKKRVTLGNMVGVVGGGKRNEYHGGLPRWGAVEKGDASWSAKMHPGRVLFM